MVIDIAVPINTGSTVVEGVRKHAEVSKACVCSDHPIDSIGVDVGFEETQVDDFCNLGTVVGRVVWAIPRHDRLKPGTTAQHLVDGKLAQIVGDFRRTHNRDPTNPRNACRLQNVSGRNTGIRVRNALTSQVLRLPILTTDAYLGTRWANVKSSTITNFNTHVEYNGEEFLTLERANTIQRGSEFGEKGNGSGRRYSDSGRRLPEIQVPVR